MSPDTPGESCMCGTQELLPKIDPDLLQRDGMRPTPAPRRLVFTGRTRERSKDPAKALTTLGFITHIRQECSAGLMPAESRDHDFWMHAIKHL